MPVINERVRVARVSHRCDDCGRMSIHPGDKYTRMFGSAERGDKPYEIKICSTCKDPNAPEPDGYDYIRSRYRVPVRVEQRIMADGHTGTVVRSKSSDQYVHILMDGAKHPKRAHPTWETVYYNEDGTIAADYREQKMGVTA